MIKGEKGVDADRHDSVPTRASRPALDPVSKAIIEHLQQDGRRSHAAIAQSVGITEADARERVRDLIDSGVMQIVAVTDPLQLGFARQAMLGITVDGDRRAVAAKIAEVVGVSDAHLLELVTARIRPIPGVRSIHTFLYEELQKQTYSWGVR